VGPFDFFRRKPAWAAAVAIGYAATDEWHQTFVLHRGGHVTDVMIDSIGVVIALMGWFLVMKRRNRIKNAGLEKT
jgi:VanZ family protein